MQVPKKSDNPLVKQGLTSQAIKGLVNFAVMHNLKPLNAQSSPFVVDGVVQPYDVNNTPQFVSKLGTVVYSNIIFNGANILKNGAIVGSFKDYRIDDCLLSVSQTKEIITTKIQGRDGTVKEYIGMSDFNIQIVGRITGAYNVYEKDLVATLKKILDSGQPLAVTSWWLQNLDITDIVIKSYDFPQKVGEYSTQYFTINAVSDKVVEALITGQ